MAFVLGSSCFLEKVGTHKKGANKNYISIKKK
jgi:hypothetical protein